MIYYVLLNNSLDKKKKSAFYQKKNQIYNQIYFSLIERIHITVCIYDKSKFKNTAAFHFKLKSYKAEQGFSKAFGNWLKLDSSEITGKWCLEAMS